MVCQVLSSVSGFFVCVFLETLSLDNLSAFLQQNRLRLITIFCSVEHNTEARMRCSALMIFALFLSKISAYYKWQCLSEQPRSDGTFGATDVLNCGTYSNCPTLYPQYACAQCDFGSGYSPTCAQRPHRSISALAPH